MQIARAYHQRVGATPPRALSSGSKPLDSSPLLLVIDAAILLVNIVMLVMQWRTRRRSQA